MLILKKKKYKNKSLITSEIFIDISHENIFVIYNAKLSKVVTWDIKSNSISAGTIFKISK